MSAFRFIHCADVHLDSPLRGLDRYEGAPIDEIRGATREALKNLVDLAVDKGVAFVLIAGDLYDGDWKDYNTGLFFAAQMSRLRRADVEVFLISGNHDAASQVSRRLSLPENVHVFPDTEPQTRTLDPIGVAVHGQSFPGREVTKDLSAAYPQARSGLFNIGMLHTSADGREGHAPYAPSSVEGLLSRGYDYWALGHVHQREILHEDPWIVFPGNTQGRHIRETGAKGCTLVSVDEGEVEAVEHRALDVLRWAGRAVDAGGLETTDEVLDRVGDAIRDELERAQGRMLALRLRVEGLSGNLADLCADRRRWSEELRGLATDVSAGRVWVEKVDLETAPRVSLEGAGDGDEAVGGLLRSIEAAAGSEETLRELADQLADVRRKLPRELLEGEAALDIESPEAIRGILEEVKPLLVPRLLRSGEGK